MFLKIQPLKIIVVIGERANVTLTVLGKNMLNYYIKMFSLK